MGRRTIPRHAVSMESSIRDFGLGSMMRSNLETAASCSAGHEPSGVPEAIARCLGHGLRHFVCAKARGNIETTMRTIKRYSNRKLYDTQNGRDGPPRR